METPPKSESYDVFVSYHSGDSDWVSELVAGLERRSVKVWIDSQQIGPGDPFISSLERGLASARCVLLVVSVGSSRSGWVREEYHRALTLINGSPDERVLIPVLIDDAEPPGFLASRAWVDFRDASKHAEKLEELVRAIRREQPAGASDHFVNPLRGDPCPAAGSGIDEVEFLARQIARTREDVGRFRRIRRYSPAPGASVAALLWILTNGLDALDGLRSSVLAALLISMPLVTALIAWSVTHAELSACRRKLQRDHVLRDGLELCRARTGPDCRRLREKFWEIVLEQANAPASPS